jgi:hypothetical protein
MLTHDLFFAIPVVLLLIQTVVSFAWTAARRRDFDGILRDLNDLEPLQRLTAATLLASIVSLNEQLPTHLGDVLEEYGRVTSSGPRKGLLSDIDWAESATTVGSDESVDLVLPRFLAGMVPGRATDHPVKRYFRSGELIETTVDSDRFRELSAAARELSSWLDHADTQRKLVEPSSILGAASTHLSSKAHQSGESPINYRDAAQHLRELALSWNSWRDEESSIISKKRG